MRKNETCVLLSTSDIQRQTGATKGKRETEFQTNLQCGQEDGTTDTEDYDELKNENETCTSRPASTNIDWKMWQQHSTTQ